MPEAKRTKFYHTLESNLDYFGLDLELMDILRSNILSETISPLKNLNKGKYVYLARRRNTKVGREQLANHLRKTLFRSYVKDAYEELTAYLQRILYSSARTAEADMNRLLGDDDNRYSAREIMKFGSWEKLCEHVTKNVFRSLEKERSSYSLLCKLGKKLDLNIPENVIKQVLPFLEIRHLLVHNDGRADEKFRTNYPHIRLRENIVDLDFALISGVRRSILSVAEAYDMAMIEKGMIPACDMMPLSRNSVKKDSESPSFQKVKVLPEKTVSPR